MITNRTFSMSLLSTAFLALVLLACGAVRAAENEVQQTWQMLDYIAVDYPGAVSDGEVIEPTEYAEQVEFAATVAQRIADLPAQQGKEALLAQATALQRAIDDKAAATEVASLAQDLAAALLEVYPVPLAPRAAPDLSRAAELYEVHCAACHGGEGRGDGPAGVALDPPPIAFTDRERAAQRSLFALYQVITFGLEDTAMVGYPQLSEEERWALAFFIAQFTTTPSEVADGERLWQQNPAFKQLLPDLAALTSISPANLAARVGGDEAAAVLAYLRSEPQAVVQDSGSLNVARTRLRESLAAVQSGAMDQARTLALSAYLDGFEPIEPALRAHDSALLTRIEGQMLDYRAALQRGESAENLAQRVRALETSLNEAEAALSAGEGAFLSIFLGAAAILLREGLEALLIVVAMVAFLRKAERPELMPYIHGGWIGALVAGFFTWIVATWMVSISGASRELTEGFGALCAAAVLLSVGIWMHGRAQAGQWQRYIREKMSKALSARSAWFLCALAFIVVYREVFETILFYAALSAQGNGIAMLAGALTACVALAGIAWAMLRYSRKLPIGKFFAFSSWLMAILAVVLAGKGVAALQEAGLIELTPLAGVPRVELLGLFPTLQSVAAQLLIIVLLAAGFAWNKRQASGRPLS